jgi:hypothetical protein
MAENPSHGGTVAEIGDLSGTVAEIGGLIIGDIPISEFLLGTPAKRRLIPHLRGELPIFELNGKALLGVLGSLLQLQSASARRAPAAKHP